MPSEAQTGQLAASGDTRVKCGFSSAGTGKAAADTLQVPSI